MSRQLISVQGEIRAILLIFVSKESANFLLFHLQRAHFFSRAGGEVYSLIQKTISEGRDLPSLKVFLGDGAISKESLELILPALRDMGSLSNPLADAEATYKWLEELRKLRLLGNIASQILTTLEDEAPKTQETLHKIDSLLVEIKAGEDKDRIIHIGYGSTNDPVVGEILSGEKKDFIRTGFQTFDEESGGLLREDLLILTSSSSGGKSAVAQNIGVTNYQEDCRNVAVVTLELGKRQYVERIVSELTKIPYRNIRIGDLSLSQQTKATVAWEKFEGHGKKNKCRLSIFAGNMTTVSDIFYLIRPFRYDLVIVDMITELDAPEVDGTQAQKLGMVGWQLKQMARKLNCVVIALAQLSEDGDVKYARAVKEHADLVWAWDRDGGARASKTLTVKQIKTRSVIPFDLLLAEEFEVMSVSDKTPKRIKKKISRDEDKKLAEEILGEGNS